MSYERMLYQICEERGIKLQFLSKNWVKRLEKSGKVRYIVGYKFDLNSQATSLIADDKYATFAALSFARVPVIRHAIFYEPGNRAGYAQGCNTLEYAAEKLAEYGGEMIIKANAGTCGRQVFKVTSLENLVEALPKVFKQSDSASLCPFYRIRHEYRVVLLDEVEKLSYMKVKSAGAWFNLDLGAKAEPIPPEKHARLLELARQAARAIGLRFGSVDMIETTDGELMVLEINSGVMTRHYLEQHPSESKKIKAMYAEVIEKMFEKFGGTDRN